MKQTMDTDVNLTNVNLTNMSLTSVSLTSVSLTSVSLTNMSLRFVSPDSWISLVSRWLKDDFQTYTSGVFSFNVGSCWHL
jgi:Pentapeptide repeats (8 copies)